MRLFLLISFWPFPVLGAVVINEFFPDPDGADTGKEFVELLNSGDQAVDLLGVALEFANGNEGAVWSSRWVCQENTVLPAGHRFLLVDRNWMGEHPGQVEVWLGLQNGPDAIRLVHQEQVLDLVGYGPLTDPLMMETSPAAVEVGQTVARRPDGHDTDNNGLDFISSVPTPGAQNFHPYALNLSSFHLDPPSASRSGVRINTQLELTNTGTENLPTAPVVLHVFGAGHEALLDASGPGESRLVNWLLHAGEPGTWPLSVEVTIPAAGGSLVLEVGKYQVGPGSLYLNEVLPAPGDGQGEWVELACQGPEAVALENFNMRDEDGDWVALPPALLQPGDLAVVAQDPPALNAWLLANRLAGATDECSVQETDPSIMSLQGGWPTLNNSPAEGRDFADRIYLADAAGTVLDQVILGGPGAEDALDGGRSWERIASYPTNPSAENWAPCTSLATGTPGCPNSVSYVGTTGDHLSITPAILDPARGQPTIHFRFEVEGEAQGWWLRVFNTWGESVRDLGGDLFGAGPRDLIWDGKNDQGREVPQGAYIVLLQLRGAAGEVVANEKKLTAVRRQGSR